MGYGLLEDLPTGGNQVKEDGGTASALPVDRDLVGVAAEATDVALNPFEGLNLIQETDVIIRKSPTSEVWVGEESERRQTIIDGDNDDFLALVDPVIEGKICGVSINEAASVNVE